MTAVEDIGAALAAAAGDDPAANEILNLWLDTKAEVEAACKPIEWADDEIRAAQTRHPGEADRIYHGFMLMWPLPGFKFPDLEWFYRGHFAEIAERLGTGGDTREATDAEICLLMSRASLAAPLRTAAFGLYVRAWCRAFPHVKIGLGSMGEELAHYERMHGTEMDDFQREARTAVARRNPGRRIAKDLACPGLHWGEPEPDCRYIKTAAPAKVPARQKRATPAGRARTRARAKTPPPDAGLAGEVAALLDQIRGK